jgi:hypothetical protein
MADAGTQSPKKYEKDTSTTTACRCEGQEFVNFRFFQYSKDLLQTEVDQLLINFVELMTNRTHAKSGKVTEQNNKWPNRTALNKAHANVDGLERPATASDGEWIRIQPYPPAPE